MVTNKKNIIPALKDRKAALLAFTPAILTAAVSASVPMEAGLVLPVFGFLIMSVFFGLVALWWQAETERQNLATQLAGQPSHHRKLSAHPRDPLRRRSSPRRPWRPDTPPAA